MNIRADQKIKPRDFLLLLDIAEAQSVSPTSFFVPAMRLEAPCFDLERVKLIRWSTLVVDGTLIAGWVLTARGIEVLSANAHIFLQPDQVDHLENQLLSKIRRYRP